MKSFILKLATLSFLYLSVVFGLEDDSSSAATSTRSLDNIKSQLGITSPGFDNQWNLLNLEEPGHDINVVPVWQQGLTGKGVTIAIVDRSALDYEHLGLRENYRADASYDFKNNISEPPSVVDTDTHGTRCAGVAAGAKDGECGVGVAYDAKIAGIQLDYDNIVDPNTLSYKSNLTDIYSNSWNTGGTGDKMTGSRPIMQQSILNGITQGRGGKGSIYVFSSGNGNRKGDNCNFDSHANSIYTIAVGAILHNDKIAKYSEGCSSLMVVSYGGDKHAKKISTTFPGGQCTNNFTGTSASTPMVAGVVALLLQARPDFSWRDIQHVLIQSAVPIDINDMSWEDTKFGREFSNVYGFGKVDAFKSLIVARSHKLVGNQIRITEGPHYPDQRISDSGRSLTLTINYTHSDKLSILEHITVTLDISHKQRNDIEVELKSPNGIISKIVESRSLDESKSGFNNFSFMTLKHWDESPVGKWYLKINDIHPHNKKKGTLNSWSVTFYGQGQASDNNV